MGLCSLLLILPMAGCGTAKVESQSYENAIKTARTEIWKAIAGGGASSATIAIMENGKVVYKEGFAMANRVEASPVDANTQFNIGSVSKIFTAAAVMKLVEEKKVDLDKPVVDYVPEFIMKDSRYKDITVRMLLNHTSGLPGTDTYDGFDAAINNEFLQEFMTYLANSNLKTTPGTVSVYCNDGFMLAEVLIEKVSGQSYSEYLKKNIFTKADMGDTSCYFKEGNTNIALKYDNQTGKALPAEYINLMGTGGISSTAVDLCKFGNALLTNKILSAESFAEYTSPQYGKETLPSGTPITNYGLGWDMVSVADFAEQGVQVLSKNGATLEFNSQFYVIPEQQISIALVFAGTAETTTIANAITQALLEEKGVISTIDQKETTAAKPAAIPDEMKKFAGYYGTSGNIIKIEFDQEKGTVNYKRFNGTEFVSEASYPYMDSGYFEMPSGYRMSFSESFGKKLITQWLAKGDYGIVVGEALNLGSAVDTQNFAGKWWIPINFTAADLYPYAVQTGSIAELPGYIFYGGDGSFTPYQLKDPNIGQMVMAYARDQIEPKISEVNGKKVLSAANYVFMDPADVLPLKNAESVGIEKANENQARKLAQDGTISVGLPEGGRFIVFSPDFTVSYDSLYSGAGSAVVIAGSYVIFIGNQGDSFACEYTV